MIAEPEETPQEQRQPEPGSYAYTARLMSDILPDFDWDLWKDQMKEES